MAYQFGIGLLYAGPAVSEIEFGCVQGVTLDFSFEKAMLHCGNALYPRDVRIHTASITGKAQYADIDAESVAKILVGSAYSSGDTLTLTDTSKPDAFRIRFATTTDSITMTVTLNSVQSDSLSWSFARTDYVIPDFGFTAFADADGNVGTIDLGDAS